MNQQPEISIVCPVYEAGKILPQLVQELEIALQKLGQDYEIILIEDGSFDDSWMKIQELCSLNSRILGVKLSRNFGQQYAIQAGFDQAKGKYIVTIDCDLQDPPSEIGALYRKCKEGFQIVVAKKIKRKDNVFHKLFSWIFNLIIKSLSDFQIEEGISNYAMYEKKVIDEMSRFNDNIRYYPILRTYIGFKISYLEIEQNNRLSGKSSYTLLKKFQLALDIILNFSAKPLKFVIFLGMFFATISILATISLVIIYLYSDYVVKGWASLALIVTFFSGIIISVLGMVGLYIGKIFDSVKQRPTYIVQEITSNE